MDAKEKQEINDLVDSEAQHLLQKDNYDLFVHGRQWQGWDDIDEKEKNHYRARARNRIARG